MNALRKLLNEYERAQSQAGIIYDPQLALEAPAELERLRAIEKFLTELIKQAEDHRNRYSNNALAAGGSGSKESHDYWIGRRDEAGHFRDELARALEEK